MAAALFTPGTLQQLTRDTTARARAAGALLPIATDARILERDGLRFQLRVVESLKRKDAQRAAALPGAGQAKGSARDNPFLPYDEDLYVADVSATHVALLNKFNVLDDHLLIVPRDFQHQEELLTVDDLAATWRCLDEIPGLAFYNGGEAGGASQSHKHMQLVPLPLVPGEHRVPIAPLIDRVPREQLTVLSELGCRNAVWRLPRGWSRRARGVRAERSREIYLELLAAVGLEPGDAPPGARQSGPYNLLVTREWLLLAPRSQEFHAGISVNAVGFAGAFLVRDAEQLTRIEELGPLTVLAAVGVAR